MDSDAVLNPSWTRFGEDFGRENEGFWDVVVVIFSLCTESRGSLKIPLLVVPEGLSRLSKDPKIKENSMKNSTKNSTKIQ